MVVGGFRSFLLVVLAEESESSRSRIVCCSLNRIITSTGE